MDFDRLGDTVRDFVTEKPLVSAIIGIVTLLFLVALVISVIQTAPQKKQIVAAKTQTFTADAPVLIPPAPDVEKDYYPSRTVKNAWTKAEVEPWFTEPDAETLQSLEKTNDVIANAILGAAP